ncbi:hypothetical protein PV10_03927 [Exophiala mesophila]|uniref:Uncharacterized protein n=1 Tax=Exophiala mesophila TaxID=212818 RepID=A0A0D1ZFK2_EXOME|nr:uncharacterized protein PV10_03927 [Exophiala mesophila]KIV92654.1 hypothetical protein PV10_03927 [Exophiala mesophila]
MSSGMNTTPSTHHRLSTFKHSSTDITTHLDHRISHLTHSILPRQPYLLSVPSDIPYRHSSRFISNWYEGTPFDPSEEQLQYISFLSHQGDHETLLKVEGAWADDYGNRIEDEDLSPRTVPNTGETTPAASTHRKKISLKDYKTKARSPDSSRPPTATRSPQIHTKSPLPESKPHDSENQVTPAPVLKLDSAAAVSPKPSAQRESQTRPDRNSQELRTSDTPNAAKRRKLSPPFEDNRPIKMPTQVESQSKILKMPRLLSPTLPSPDTSKAMPDLLSPLLPASLTLALSSPSDTLSLGSPAVNPQTRTDPVKAILASADLDSSPALRNGLPPSVNRVRSDSQQSTKDSTVGTAKPVKVALPAKPLSKPPLSNGARPSPGPKQHIVVLKYGKKNRKWVEGLLKFASRSKKALLKNEEVPSKGALDAKPRKDLPARDVLDGVNHADVKPKTQPARQDETKSRVERDVKQRNVLDANSSDKKRRGGDSPPTAIKKVKMEAEGDKRPSTPNPSTGKIPSATSKSTFSTPKRDIRSAAMRRVESTDGLDAPTPTGERGRLSTPLAAPKPSPQPLTSSVSREEERQHWVNMHTKYFALGRTIKNEGTSLAPSPNDDASTGHSPKSLALLVEALLCFMINSAAQAQARPRSDAGWATIMPYHTFVFRASRKYPRVHGLVVQLGAVCRQLSHNFDMDRLARDPLPEDFCNSAPTPGSDGNTKTNEDVERYKKQYLRFRDELVHNARCLQTAWLDGPRLLPHEILKRDFPATWSKRIKDSAQRLQDKPTSTHIPKEYYLPLDVNTTAFEAVRYGLAFLQEWAEQEKIDWKTRIDL